MDITPHRQRVARALIALESSIERLIDAHAHRPAWVSAEVTHNDRDAIRQICAAHSTIDYAMEDEVGSSILCLGVAGVSTITYSRLDSRGRGRVQLAAELPLLYTAGRWPTPPRMPSWATTPIYAGMKVGDSQISGFLN